MSESTNGRGDPYGKSEWKRARKTVLERQNHECLFCGVSDEAHREEYSNGLDVHHVIPREDGGSDSPENLAALCRSCHKKLESIHARAMGQMAPDVPFANQIAEMSEIYLYHREWEKETRAELKKFVDNHPHFANEAELEHEEHRFGETRYNRAIGAYDVEQEIFSEWGALVAYGFIQGLKQYRLGFEPQDIPYEDLCAVWNGEMEMDSVLEKHTE